MNANVVQNVAKTLAGSQTPTKAKQATAPLTTKATV